MKFFLCVLLALAVLLGIYFSYEYYLKEEIPLQTTSSKNFVIGWIGPLSGPAKVLGNENLNALKMAIANYTTSKSKVNPDIQLHVADDQYQANLTESEYKKMLEEHHPQVIFMTTYSGLKKVAPRATSDRVILIDSIDNDAVLAGLSKNIFLIAKETEELAGIEAGILMEQNKKKVFILYNTNDEFMVNLAQTLKQVLNVGGIKGELVGYEQNNPNFKSYLEQSLKDNYDAYAFFGYTEVGTAMKQARDLGITSAFYSINVITDPALQKNAEGSVDGTFFAHFTAEDGNSVEATNFLKQYEEKYHEKAKSEWTALQTYDAATILLNTVKEMDSGPFVDDALRSRLLGVSNFEGVSGKISIKPNGSSRGIYPKIYVLKNGVPVPIKKN